jgi:hypothetical protein
MLETIKEKFLNELNNQSALSGSLYNRGDVNVIINAFALKVQATITALPQRSEISDELIIQICDIAEGYAKEYVEDCLDNYNYEDCVEYDTTEYNGELRVTTNVKIETSDFKRCGDFDSDNLMIYINNLLNPKQEA